MSGGAAHGGGHCSMIVSVDEKTWYKIGDYKDCTLKGSLQFTMPKGVPQECSGDAGCTFGWLWTPIFSGTCEIYMNCYHLKARVVCVPCIRTHTRSAHSDTYSQTRIQMHTLHPIVAGHGRHGRHRDGAKPQAAASDWQMCSPKFQHEIHHHVRLHHRSECPRPLPSGRRQSASHPAIWTANNSPYRASQQRTHHHST